MGSADAVKLWSMNPLRHIVPCHEVHGYVAGAAAALCFMATLVSATLFVNVTMVPDAAVAKWAHQMGFWQVLPTQCMCMGCYLYMFDLCWLGFIIYGNSFGWKMGAFIWGTLVYSFWIWFKSNRLTGDLVATMSSDSYTALPEGKA